MNLIFMTDSFGETNYSLEGKRQPHFAGVWYEANPEQLNTQLTEYLKNADNELAQHPVDQSFAGNEPPTQNIVAAIVPHAAYYYSGQTAAFAYDKLKGLKVDRIFLLGPSHYSAFRGCALPTDSVFATPLGDLQVDQGVIEELCHFPSFKQMPEVHAQEHSLELQLPLIRKTFGDIKIVPITIGNLSDESDIRLVGRVLRRYIRKGDLVIVSSDFTHYGPRYDFQPFKENIPQNIRKLDEDAFKCLLQPDLKAFLDFHEKTHDTICGFYPCSVVLSMLPPQTHASLLAYHTSRELLDDPDNNSVSYMAIVFSCPDSSDGWGATESTIDASQMLSPVDGKKLVELARLALHSHVQPQAKPPDYNKLLSPHQQALFAQRRGLFVTLYKHHAGENPQSERKDGKNLRGCIGYIWPVKSLIDAVCDNAVSAASRDHRFEPVSVDELKELQIEVSVLTPPRSVKSWQDIKLGQDGIVMHKHGLQAVFLPSVPTEFGWDLPETLTQLSIKAGCGPEGWKKDSVFDVFQVQSFEEAD
jgi:AmmeMemoRadiSam system protein B/AmmeMemoRadiSam system protein A